MKFVGPSARKAVGGAPPFLTFGAAVWRLQVHEQPLMLAVADTVGVLETLKVSA